MSLLLLILFGHVDSFDIMSPPLNLDYTEEGFMISFDTSTSGQFSSNFLYLSESQILSYFFYKEPHSNLSEKLADFSKGEFPAIINYSVGGYSPLRSEESINQFIHYLSFSCSNNDSSRKNSFKYYRRDKTSNVLYFGVLQVFSNSNSFEMGTHCYGIEHLHKSLLGFTLEDSLYEIVCLNVFILNKNYINNITISKVLRNNETKSIISWGNEMVKRVKFIPEIE